MIPRQTILSMLAMKVQIACASFFLDEIDSTQRDKQIQQAITYYNDMIDKQDEELRQETATL